MPGYNKIVLSGALASGAEIWSTSVGVYSAEGPVTLPQDLSLWATQIMAGLSAYMTGTTMLKNGLSGNGTITEAKVYYYSAIGSPAVAVGVAGGSTPGAGTGSQPLSSSAVISLRTPLAGRRYRGRMYWPALAFAPSNFGVFTSSVTGGLVSDAKTLLTYLCSKAPVAGVFVPAVVSAAANAVTPVTSLSVGSVPDTQRRRRNALIETYATSAYP